MNFILTIMFIWCLVPVMILGALIYALLQDLFYKYRYRNRRQSMWFTALIFSMAVMFQSFELYSYLKKDNLDEDDFYYFD